MWHKILAAGIENPVLRNNLGRGTVDTGVTNIGNIISALIGILITIATVASLLYLVIGGLSWIVSDGDKGKLEQARNKITQAILGLIIVVAAWAIWVLIGKVFGFNVNSLPIPILGT